MTEQRITGDQLANLYRQGQPFPSQPERFVAVVEHNISR
jgi:hypothetical protein